MHSDLQALPEISGWVVSIRLSSRRSSSVLFSFPWSSTYVDHIVTLPLWDVRWLIEYSMTTVGDRERVYLVQLYQPIAVTNQGCACCIDIRRPHSRAYPADAGNFMCLTMRMTAGVLQAAKRDGAVVMRGEVDATAV